MNTSLSPTILYWINKGMNKSDEVWRWVHPKYVMSWIIRKLHSIKTITAITFLLPNIFVWINERINESDTLSLPSSVDDTKEGMSHKILFTQYRFVNYFKSTTTYIPIHCPIFQHYQTLEVDNLLFIHDKNIWKK